MRIRTRALLVSAGILAVLVLVTVASAQTIRDALRERVLQRLQERGLSVPSVPTERNPALGGVGEAPEPIVDASAYAPVDVQVGDLRANYFNVETYGNYPYLVWIEAATDGSGKGVVWHCGINPDTGDLIPADCRGFKAFESTTLNRANIGIDSKGLYYVGADSNGSMMLVRPTGPSSGTVTKIATPPDTRRRAYYPSLLPDSSKQYVAWILNESVAAGGTDGRNSWVELQYIDIAEPADVRTIERQDRPSTGFAPMDSAFFRWYQEKPAITFGSYSSGSGIDLKEYDVKTGTATFVTDDGLRKADPYPFVFGGTEIVIPGINAGSYAYVYTRQSQSSDMYEVAEEIVVPSQTELQNPILAQSFQPIVWDGRLYVAYQINDRGDGRITNFFQIFSLPGEIWLSTVGQNPQQQWRISASNDLVKGEPEPFVGTKTAWVFYSAAQKGSNIQTVSWQLRRASVPLGDHAVATAAPESSFTSGTSNVEQGFVRGFVADHPIRGFFENVAAFFSRLFNR